MAGATTLSPNTTASAAAPTTTVAGWMSPRVRNHDPSSRRGSNPVASVPVSFGSSPITTSIAAPNRNPVTTARERNWAIHPILEQREHQEERTGGKGHEGDERGDVVGPGDPATATALAATAANPELGPVEICRLVPKIG